MCASDYLLICFAFAQIAKLNLEAQKVELQLREELTGKACVVFIALFVGFGLNDKEHKVEQDSRLKCIYNLWVFCRYKMSLYPFNSDGKRKT